TMKPGKIKIHAEVQFPGTHAPTPADLEIESVAYQGTMMMGTKTAKSATSSSVQNASSATSSSSHEFTPEQKAKMLKEVEDQQADFGINN
ncbi:beta-galactosidase, partial [human gut metagenome]